MMLADTNFWLAMSFSKHQFHEEATRWFGKQVEPVVFCRSTQQSFLRLLTTEAVSKLYGIEAMSNVEAWDFYEAMAGDRRCGFAEEPAGLEKKWAAYVRVGSASPKIWMDAYLAAFAVAGGYSLVSIDAGFRRFKDLNIMLLGK